MDIFEKDFNLLKNYMQFYSNNEEENSSPNNFDKIIKSFLLTEADRKLLKDII